MRCTVVLPGALLPAPVAPLVLDAASTPWLARVLPKAQAGPAQAIDTADAPHLDWLWRRFGGRGEPVTAPYALRALDADADTGAQCWHVDPVHLALTRDRLRVTPLDEAAFTAEEEAILASHLQAALQEFAADAAPRLHRHQGRWLLSLARPWSLRATSLDGAVAQSAHEHWPEGADAQAWRRLLTDVQMRWYTEPVNEAREARGQPPVNALWLHGGGAWSALPARPFAAVASHDPVLRGWALASGVSAESLHGEGELPAPRGDLLSIRHGLQAPARFEAWGQWRERLAAIDAQLRDLHARSFDAGYDELALLLAGRRQVRTIRLRRRDGLRFWRRTPAAALLAEAIDA